MTKNDLRKAMRLKRSSLAEERADELSDKAQAHILHEQVWKHAASVALYFAVRRETRTNALVREAWATGKQTFFPYTEGLAHGIMTLLPCKDGDALVQSSFGIPEPTPETCPLPPEGEWIPELVIVPGLAFDRKGYRLGMGAGYYDRMFSKPSMHAVIRIGLAYEFQIVDHIETEQWDIPMHALATEKGVTWL